MGNRYWTKSKGVIQGPYTREQLDQLAAARNLRPNDEVSEDRNRWVSAARLSGLTFVRPGEQVQTEDDVGEEVFTPANPDPHLPVASASADTVAKSQAASKPPPPMIRPGETRRARVTQREKGQQAGLLLAMVTFFGSVITEVVMASGDAEGSSMVTVFVVAIALGAILFALAWFGTFNEVSVTAEQGGVTDAKVVRYVAFVPISNRRAKVQPGDRLEQRFTLIGSSEPANSGLGEMLSLAFAAAMCGLPGLIWYWGKSRNQGEGVIHRLQIFLHPSKLRRPIQLYDGRVENYFVTRLAESHDSQRIVNVLRSAVADLDVVEIED